MSAQTDVMNGVLVPFRLDSSVGQNEAQILLVMCEFTIPLRGEFNLHIFENEFSVDDIDLHGSEFALPFAPDFNVNVLDVHIQRDLAGPAALGRLTGVPDENVTQLTCEIPLRISMRMLVNGVPEQAGFTTPLKLNGTIDGPAVVLTGDFVFQLEAYDAGMMRPKFGACRVLLGATSLLQFAIKDARAALTFGATTQTVRLDGQFGVGLNGLHIGMTDLALTATPYHWPGVLDIENIQIALDKDSQRLPMRFTADPYDGYQVRASIPTRLNADLRLVGFTSQPLSAAMMLYLRGLIQLHSQVQLSLEDRLEVQIGDGTVYLEVEAEISATTSTTAADGPVSGLSGRLFDQIDIEAALDVLQDHLFYGELITRRQVLYALGEKLPETTELILSSLANDPSLDVRLAALRVFRGQPVAGISAEIAQVFHMEETELARLEALLTLAALPEQEWRNVAAEALLDESALLRSQAAQVIGQRAVSDDLLLILATPLKDPDPFVRLCAASAILNHDRTDVLAIETIVSLLETDADICVQMIGCISLSQAVSRRARSAIQHIFTVSGDPFVLHAARYALEKLDGTKP